MSALAIGEDGQARCGWSMGAPDYTAYHDEEWGFAVSDDIRFFECLCLESFQSGLSWRTILSKREGFRSAFAGFDFAVIAGFDDGDIERLLLDKGIVRHRGKIAATINNAQRALDMVQSEGSLATYFWRFALALAPRSGIPPEATALAKDLKKRGWKFFGPTTAYAFMQATGLVNDHAKGCICYGKAEISRAAFTPTG